VHTIVDNGPASNRVDVVLLGDGYRDVDMAKFAADALNLSNLLFSQPPFSTYKKHFNVRRIDTPSATSNVSHNGASGNTYYGAFYNCFSIQRLICVDETKVIEELNVSLQPNERDIVIVIVNDGEYGGSGGGGQSAVTSTHADAPEIAFHEIGHSFGYLDDEYVDAPNCRRFTHPFGFNVTKASTRSTAPWSKWIAATTPIPTPIDNSAIGLFKGAFFCANGWFRPTADSKMRSLGQPFREVNSEQIIRRIYNYASVVEWVRPQPSSFIIPPGSSRTFSARTIVPHSSDMTTTWRLGGVILSTGRSVTISGNQLGGATKKLQLIARDITKSVRNDPEHALLDTFSWTLQP